MISAGDAPMISTGETLGQDEQVREIASLVDPSCFSHIFFASRESYLRISEYLRIFLTCDIDSH